MTPSIAQVSPTDGEAGQTAPDEASRRWLKALRANGARHERAVRELHAILVRAARRETHRRRAMLAGAAGPELDDLAHEAAADALVAIIDHLDTYRGNSRFTTWAYRYVINQVSLKTRRHQWRGRRAPFDEADWDRLPDRLTPSPHRTTEQHAQLEILRRAVNRDLTPRQREVFVAAALNDVPIDVIAQRLGSSRGAIYKALFDARTKLRASLAHAGYPLDQA